ncbi:hypothetical protein [Burkholderia cenocepacia]|uniref:hypothetical protein n=1 Tax=Burkholderia cenocepacia TaxID=95486 RepID=UPI001B947349|nr:hypothetical protein [Burkholderia cenocepacia]MBR8137211.1 hypothetical protein [Burkholderia cenocepacia]
MTADKSRADALTDHLYILSANEEAMEEAIERFDGSGTGEALKCVLHAQKQIRALLVTPVEQPAAAPDDDPLFDAWLRKERGRRCDFDANAGSWARAAWQAGALAGPHMDMPAGAVQWWLADLDQHGNPKLSDGAHSEREGADRAAYLHAALGLQRDRKFAVARVELFEPAPRSDGVDHGAVGICRSMVEAAQPGKRR